jgi:hypothetical protein
MGNNSREGCKGKEIEGGKRKKERRKEGEDII